MTQTLTYSEAVSTLKKQSWNRTTQHGSISKVLVNLYYGTAEAVLAEDEEKGNPYTPDAVRQAVRYLIENIRPRDPEVFKHLIRDLTQGFPALGRNAIYLYNASIENPDLFGLLYQFDSNFRGTITYIEKAGEYGYVRTVDRKDEITFYPLTRRSDGTQDTASACYESAEAALIHSIVETVQDANTAMHLVPAICRMIPLP